MSDGYEAYLSAECDRIKQDLLVEFNLILNPLEKGLREMDIEIAKINKQLNYENIYKLISPKNM